MAKPEIKVIKEEMQNTKNSINTINEQLAEIAKPIVCFTFDDGLSNDSLTYSIFKEFGYPASFGIITDEIYASSKNSLNNYNQYKKDGFEIFSHSASHSYLDTAKADDVKYHEMQSSANKLRTLGFSANGFIVPYSTIESTNLEYAKNIYDYILIGGTGLNGKNGFKRKTLTRISAFGSGVAGCKTLIDQAILNKQLLIFYDHGIGRAGSLSEAELREILTYIQNKVADNLIEVHNVKNAISKYYGINIPDRAKKSSSVNKANVITDEKWVLENNTANSTKAKDSTYPNEVLKLTIPINSAIGTSVKLSNTIELPSSFTELGERVKFAVRVAMSNSQYNNFNKYLEVSLLNSSDTVLLTKSKQIYPTPNVFEKFDFDVFSEYPVNLANVSKVKISIKFDVSTPNSVEQFIRISDVSLTFGEYTEKIITQKLTSYTINDNRTTVDVNNKEYLLISNTAPTTITNFVTSSNIQEITILFGTANTTITGNNLIRLKDGLDWNPSIGSMLTLFKNDVFSGAWFEKSRTVRTV